MKRRGIVFVFLLVAFQIVAVEPSVVNSIVHSVSSGDVESLMPYFNSSTQFNSSQSGQVSGSEKVKERLLLMYDNTTPQNFRLLHKGIKEQSAYVVATFSIRAVSYRLSIYIEGSDLKTLIKLIRIEKNENRID